MDWFDGSCFFHLLLRCQFSKSFHIESQITRISIVCTLKHIRSVLKKKQIFEIKLREWEQTICNSDQRRMTSAVMVKILSRFIINKSFTQIQSTRYNAPFFVRIFTQITSLCPKFLFLMWSQLSFLKIMAQTHTKYCSKFEVPRSFRIWKELRKE